ncbi:NifU-like protein involved in Fe-S cluster formation [Erythromicrobium ramosum]|uniref:NifU-like protein involved in Fe-S cluster formation n=1 Tax=Erythrobacter ramosus TaxID=35811 RepID=A0ABR6HZF5_9SPHN|nr:iron-sulfur cluster assembly scaffold protein [Erythrobacter ramosus]MBB3776041.1 NifU-like protein involved in Fe-S cluster formation [Erythrobacter ramosus]
MTARPAAKLYSPALLGLATELAQFPLEDTLPLRAEARSRSCGSVIALGLALAEDGHVGQIGMTVSACAIGQASAALLARSAIGAEPARITATTATLTAWLAGEGDLPNWPGLDVLSPALPHPGRHGALLLPWKAACEALSSGAEQG